MESKQKLCSRGFRFLEPSRERPAGVNRGEGPETVSLHKLAPLRGDGNGDSLEVSITLPALAQAAALLACNL